MATIFIDKSDGMIAVRDSYDVKEKCSSAGCFWDGDSKLWKMVFTLDTFERLIKKIPEANIDPYVFKALESQKNKEDKLAELREKASRNEDIHFRVLGLKANPFPYQKLGILYAVTNGNGMMIGDSMGLGKALVSNTHIFTPTGKVEIGSLKVGDKVIGRNGKECTVTGVYPQGFEDIYRITFTDGFWIDCGPEHLWEVSSPCSNRQEKNSFVFSVSQLNDPHGNYSHFGYGHNEKKEYRIKTYYKYKNGNNRWSIPIVEPIRFTSKPVPIDPYLLGIFLGDGHISKRGYVSITKRLEDLQEMVIKSVKPNKGKPHLGKCFFSEYSQSIIEFGLNGKRSWEKNIPALYKYNSPNIRLALLQGLMDTDGSAGDGTTEYSTSSKSLCDDVVELVQSLGGIVRLRTRIPVYTYNGVKKKGRTSYRLNIKLHPSMNPFRLQRKAKKYLVPEKYVPARYIDRIEKLPEQQETVCIAVDSEDHLYVAEHCIVTHNTMQAIASALILKQKGLVKNCLVITPASLKFNWPLEIEKFTNETCLVINGKKPEDRIAQWLDDSCFFKIANYELVVEDLGAGREYKEKKGEDPEQTKKRVARKVKQFIKQKKLAQVKEKVWDLIILDEIHACKHGTSKRHKAVKAMKAKMKIGLSGTPMDGRLEELFTLMGIIAPGILGSRTSFFTRYVTTDFFGAVKGYKNIQEVQDKIAPFFIRRMKKDVLKDLPEKLYENKVIALTDEELKIYNAIKKGKHPSVIDKDGQVAEPMVRAIRCMQFVNFPQMVDSSCKASTKLDVFRDVVEELVQMNGQKIIIFTQFKQILNLVDQILKEMKLKFLRIDGDTDKVLRADYQKLFNEDPTIDCIIGTDAMSTGLNLIGGDTVLNLTQSWQPAIMSQREDRSYRIGRKENVTVLNFLCKDTIEEKIRRVLYSKDKITSETLGDGTDEAVLRKLGPQEIEDLL